MDGAGPARPQRPPFLAERRDGRAAPTDRPRPNEVPAVSPRRNRPRGAPKASSAREEQDRYGLEHTEEWRGEEWVVRRISGGAAAKHYRCPGCDQEIPPGVPHVVTWQREGSVDDRRHWHGACWGARERRSARMRRPGGAQRWM